MYVCNRYSRVLCIAHSVLPVVFRRECGLPVWPSEVSPHWTQTQNATLVGDLHWLTKAYLPWSVVATIVVTHVLTGHLALQFVETLALFHLRAQIMHRFNKLTRHGLAHMAIGPSAQPPPTLSSASKSSSSSSSSPAIQMPMHTRQMSAVRQSLIQRPPEVFTLNTLADLRNWSAARQHCELYAQSRLYMAEVVTGVAVVLGLVIAARIVIEFLLSTVATIVGAGSISALQNSFGGSYEPAVLTPRAMISILLLSVAAGSMHVVSQRIGRLKKAQPILLRIKMSLVRRSAAVARMPMSDSKTL